MNEFQLEWEGYFLNELARRLNGRKLPYEYEEAIVEDCGRYADEQVRLNRPQKITKIQNKTLEDFIRQVSNK